MNGPAEHVRALHMRRNLTPLQQARLALAIGNYEHEREAAKARQAHGQTAPGRTLPANWPEASTKDGEALAYVSVATGVPVRTLRRAAFVEKHAIPEVRQSQTLSVSEPVPANWPERGGDARDKAIGNYQQAQADAKARMLGGKANPSANWRQGSHDTGKALAYRLTHPDAPR